MTDKERFNEIINANQDAVLEKSRREHKSMAFVVDNLWKKYQKDCAEQQASLSVKPEPLPNQMDLLKAIVDPEVSRELVIRRNRFAKWYGMATQSTVDTNGNHVSPKLNINQEWDGYNDSLQDSMMWYYNNPDKIPEDKSKWKVTLLTRAGFTRLKNHQKSKGKDSRGKLPKSHIHETYAHTVKYTEDSVPIVMDELPNPDDYKIETKLVNGKERVTFE